MLFWDYMRRILASLEYPYKGSREAYLKAAKYYQELAHE